MEKTKSRRNKYYKIAVSIFVCFIVLGVGLTAFFTVHRSVTPLDEKQQETFTKMIDMFEDNDDIQEIYHNVEE